MLATTIIIPWGEWVYNFIKTLEPVILTFSAVSIPVLINNALVRFFASGALTNAVNAAIANTENAVRGASSSVDVSNQILNEAIRWMIANEPKAANYYGPKLRDFLTAELAKTGTIPYKSINPPKK